VGGLISYSAVIAEHYALAAVYVDKILKGAKPAELPVEQPTRYELIVNLRTAKSLGLPMPQSVLLRAQEIVQ
jgi:putative ABC transport system substrate-binding protein